MGREACLLRKLLEHASMLQCVLQCVAVSCSVLQRVLQCVVSHIKYGKRGVLIEEATGTRENVAVCCSACCSVLQCLVVCCSVCCSVRCSA